MNFPRILKQAIDPFAEHGPDPFINKGTAWNKLSGKFKEDPSFFKNITQQHIPNNNHKALSEMYDLGVGGMSPADRASTMKRVMDKYNFGKYHQEEIMKKNVPGSMNTARLHDKEVLKNPNVKRAFGTAKYDSGTGKFHPRYTPESDKVMRETQSMLRQKSPDPMTRWSGNMGSKTLYPGRLIAPVAGYLGTSALSTFGNAADNYKRMGVSTRDLPHLYKTERNLREKGGVTGALASIPVSAIAGLKTMFGGKSKGWTPGYGNQQARLQKDRDTGNQPKATGLVNPKSNIADYSSGALKDPTRAMPGAPSQRAQSFLAKKKLGDTSNIKIPSWLKYKPVAPKLPNYNKQNIPKQPGFSFGQTGQ